MKNIKFIALFLVMSIIFSGCTKKQTNEEYVYELLDIRLQGYVPKEEGKEKIKKAYEEKNATAMFFTDYFLLGDMEVDDEKRKEFDEISKKILSSSRYKVIGEENGYVIVEAYENLAVLEAIKDLEKLSIKLKADSLNIDEEKREEFLKSGYIDGAKEILTEKAEKPKYGEKIKIKLKVKNTDGERNLPDSEWTLFLRKLFKI